MIACWRLSASTLVVVARLVRRVLRSSVPPASVWVPRSRLSMIAVIDWALLASVPLTMPLREQADAGLPLVFTDPDDPAAQGIRHAARGLVALFPTELPMLQAVPAAQPEAPAPTGFQLPVVQA